MRVNSRAAWASAIAMAVLSGVAFLIYNGDYLSSPQGGVAEARVEARTSDGTGTRPEWQPPKAKSKAKIVSADEREDLLRRAHIWRAPAVPIPQANFREPAPLAFLECRFRVTELGGTTAKFDCDLPSGEPLRIKYGQRSGELQAEYAATRLLQAFGFGADAVSYVEKVRCYGCPEAPFSTMKAVEIAKAEKLYKSLLLSYDAYEEFEWAMIERKFPADAIETDKLEGWAMFELDKVDPSKGGAPRAHVDALRLLAVLLAHWDNKAKNQRLVCRSQDDWKEGAPCATPFLLLQDVGATFGPSKVDLDDWTAAPIWEDRATCRASMADLPYDGATFAPVHISEAGRRFLTDLLIQLTDQQLIDLFTAGRFDQAVGVFPRRSPVAEWVKVFKAKAREITEGPPCQPATSH